MKFLMTFDGKPTTPDAVAGQKLDSDASVRRVRSMFILKSQETSDLLAVVTQARLLGNLDVSTTTCALKIREFLEAAPKSTDDYTLALDGQKTVGLRKIIGECLLKPDAQLQTASCMSLMKSIYSALETGKTAGPAPVPGSTPAGK